MRSVLTICFMLFLFSYSFAQKQDKFSEESTVFIKELDEFLNATKNKNLKNLFSQFEDNFNAEKFNVAQKKQFIALANKMLEKRLRPNPHFANLIKSVNQFAYHPTSLPKFNDWLSVVAQLMEESTTKRLMMYVIFTHDFLSSGMLRNSSAVRWYCWCFWHFWYCNKQFFLKIRNE